MLKSASSQPSHPASFPKKDLWTLLLDQKGRDAKTVSDETAAHETVLLVAGSKSSGKTSLLHRFLERDDTPTPTIGLEYTYGRKSRGLNNIKDMTHIWELAGGNHLSDLLEIPLNESNIHTATLFIVLDLSEPSQVVPIAEHFFGKLKARVTTILENLEKRGSKRPKGLKAFAWKKYGGEAHPDRDLISPSPIPIVIIGNKYDVFRDFEPERRKHLTRMLRYLCHLNGATLLYVSTKDENLIMRFRHTVSHHAFRSNAPRGFSTDYNKPVFIMAGSDAFSQIVSNASDGNAELGINYMGIYEKWKAEYSSLFPSKEPASTYISGHLDIQKFPEPDLDKLRLQKDEELERYRVTAERKMKQGLYASGDARTYTSNLGERMRNSDEWHMKKGRSSG